MDYQRVYDKLIERCNNRPKPLEYCEEHHILPVALGGLDVKDNLVYLSLREHFVAHLLLAKITNHPKMWLAVKAMSSFNSRSSSRMYESAKIKVRPHQVEVGKRSGAKCSELKIGVHARSVEERKAHGSIGGSKAKEMGVGIYSPGMAAYGGRVAGKLAVDNKTGIHSLTNEEKKVNQIKGGKVAGRITFINKTGIHGMKEEDRKASQVKAAARALELKVGIHARSKEEMTLHGRAGIAKTNSQLWKCTECGRESTPSGIANHQIRTNHSGKERLK